MQNILSEFNGVHFNRIFHNVPR